MGKISALVHIKDRYSIKWDTKELCCSSSWLFILSMGTGIFESFEGTTANDVEILDIRPPNF